MRIIYEDGEYRDENSEETLLSQSAEDFIDISSISEEQKKQMEEEDRTGKPYRPAATLRPAEKKKEEPVKLEASQPVQQPVQYPQSYPPPYAPAQYPQGYPYVQYPQGYPYGQYPQGYPAQYPQQPVYMPVQYPPFQPQPVQRPADANMPDAGTRVLYQSPDFDKSESPAKPTAPAPTVYTAGSSITQSDVGSFPPRPAAKKSTSFEVDDMEMSVFELDSIAHKYSTKAKQVAKPCSASGSLAVEDFDGQLDDADYENPWEEEDEPEKKKKKTEKKKSVKKKPGKKKKSDLPRKIVLAISVIAIIASVGVLLNEFRLSRENQDVEQEVSNLIIDVPEQEDSSKDEDKDKNGKNEDKDKDKDKDNDKDKEQEEQLTPEQQWEKVRNEFPDVIFPSEIQLKYAKLYGTNRDFVGYLSAPGVELNLPVVQTDDDETYLKKNFYGKNTKYGCPFVTHLNTIGSTRESLDTNTVIFGHYMKDGSVFGNLFRYKTIDGFKSAPVIEFNTLYHDYQWKIIAAFITNADAKDDNDYVFKYYFTNLSTRDRYAAFLSELSQRSIYDTGVDVLPDDKILTLSTCSYEFENARFVVVARLVRFGESPEVDVSKATVNPNPRYPQAYYDKKKQNNPYKDASRWEVG